MAESLRAELECSVCLNTFTDPVNLAYGHNFCRVCIDRVLDTQEGPGGYSCPECREEFVKRPALYRNIALRKILDNIMSTDQEETRIPCTYCVDIPAPAVKSCLLCEASLCEKHLRVHSNSTEHVLCDPTPTLNNRKCSVHKKILDHYCTEDSICICLLCKFDGAHQGHHLEMLNEASQKREKKLKNVLEKMLMIREETEQRLQRLQDHRKKSEEKACSEKERVTALFGELRRQQEDLEKKVLSQISGQAKGVLHPINDLIQDLEIKKDELSRQMCHIRELSTMTDPLAILQQPCTDDLWDIQEENDKQKCDKQLQSDLNFSLVSHTLYKDLSNIITEVAKMIPVSTPLAMSSALPWEKVTETWDDHTSLEELAGGLSREQLSQHQLHPHSIMKEKTCFEQPMQKVEENESSSEESHGGKIFRNVSLRWEFTEEESEEEDTEEDKSEEEDAEEEEFEEDDAKEDKFEEEDAKEDDSEKEDAEEEESEEEDAEEEEFEEENAEEDEFEEEDVEFESEDAEEDEFEEEDAEEDESEEQDSEEEEESEEEDAKGKKSGKDNAEEDEESEDAEEESEEEDAEEEESEDAVHSGSSYSSLSNELQAGRRQDIITLRLQITTAKMAALRQRFYKP